MFDRMARKLRLFLRPRGSIVSAAPRGYYHQQIFVNRLQARKLPQCPFNSQGCYGTRLGVRAVRSRRSAKAVGHGTAVCGFSAQGSVHILVPLDVCSQTTTVLSGKPGHAAAGDGRTSFVFVRPQRDGMRHSGSVRQLFSGVGTSDERLPWFQSRGMLVLARCCCRCW